jgi:hypothetical protein
MIASDAQREAMQPSDEVEFELHCDGDFAASASGPRERAWSEIQHYAAQYAQDGPVTIYEVTRRPIQLQGAASPQGATVDAENAKPVASNGPDGPSNQLPGNSGLLIVALAADLPALLLQAVEALEKSRECILNSGWHEQLERNDRVAAALRLRIGRE